MAVRWLSDPQGRRVMLLDRTWEKHILRLHPELCDQRRTVEEAITQPMEVRRSADTKDHPSGIQYYGRCAAPSLYLMVATEEVRWRGQTLRMVKTACFVRKIGRGTALWP